MQEQDQLPLFPGRTKRRAAPLPHVRGSDTSAAAGKRAADFAPQARDRILAFLDAAGATGATDAEMQSGCRMEGNTQRPRRVELWRAGEILQRGSRPGPNGRKAAVWVLRRYAKA